MIGCNTGGRGVLKVPMQVFDPLTLDLVADDRKMNNETRLAHHFSSPSFGDFNTADLKEDDTDDDDDKENDDDDDAIFTKNRTSLSARSFPECRRHPLIRSRTFSTPVQMRSNAECQVGKYLRRISDDFNSKIPPRSPPNERPPEVGLQRPQLSPDTHGFPDPETRRESAPQLPPPRSAPDDVESDGLWRRVVSYFRTRPDRTRTQSESDVDDNFRHLRRYSGSREAVDVVAPSTSGDPSRENRKETRCEN